MIRSTALAALLLTLTITTPAAAEEHVWQVGQDFTVRATGLDLGTTDGRERLLRRVEAATARVCGKLQLRIDRLQCVELTQADVLASAPAALRGPLQTALAARQETRLAAR
jgi:UrcA family protein